ncbi:MAG TPA: NfeD family protein [Alphaproteobacteria bacterium]|nr:NfeD family protein [Alphaproteobacteria bacterium]
MFEDLVYWHWWALAIALGVVEIVAPGTYFLWLGAAAAVVGFVVLLVPGLPPLGQWFLFAVLAFVAIFVSRALLRRYPIETDEPDLNRRGQQYVGRVLTLEAPIRNGRGRIKVGDSVWAIAGADMPEGTRVRVTGVDGVTLLVERATPAD